MVNEEMCDKLVNDDRSMVLHVKILCYQPSTVFFQPVESSLKQSLKSWKKEASIFLHVEQCFKDVFHDLSLTINPLSNNKHYSLVRFERLCRRQDKCDSRIKLFRGRKKNIVGKGENAGN